jgi:hypothetical protein
MFECKFRLTSMQTYEPNPECKRPVNVEMCGVKSEPFGKYTPSAKVEMFIQNDAVFAELEPGAEYLVTFTKMV